MLTTLLAVGSASALAGCGSCGAVAPSAWHGDSRFTADERQAIESGEAWLAAHAGRAPATFDWSYDATNALSAQEAHTIRRERGPRDDSGECTGFTVHVGRGTTVYLDPVGLPGDGFRPEYLPGLAAHEMAHCELGFVDGYRLNDVPTDGIMRVLYPMRWTAAEDAQLALTQ